MKKIQSFPIEVKQFDITNDEEGNRRIKMYIDVTHQKNRDNLHEWLLEQDDVKKIKMKFQ